nr:hypothetical protein [uncultured Oscillibacter sp.]
MNIRKPADYSELYRTLDRLMMLELIDTELCYKIGQAICARSEKGAAVVAAEYLRENYPDRTGCSPRNLRRMRDFYRAYTGFLVELHLPVDCDGAQREISTIPSDAKNFTFAYL